MIDSSSHFSFFPAIIAMVVILATMITVFKITERLGIVFRRGFQFLGFGMTFLWVWSVIDTIYAIAPWQDSVISDLTDEVSILLASVFILIGVRKIYTDIVGKQ